jgi:hypothetical protein
MFRSLVASPISWLLSKGIALLARRGASQPPGRGSALAGLDTTELRQRKESNERRIRTIKSAEAAKRLVLENEQIEEILRERAERQEPG